MGSSALLRYPSLPRSLTFRCAPLSVPDNALISGYLWHNAAAAFRVPLLRSFGFVVPLSLPASAGVLPSASAAPDTGRGSDLLQQGGCQQANLLAREAFASGSNLTMSTSVSTISNVSISESLIPDQQMKTYRRYLKYFRRYTHIPLAEVCANRHTPRNRTAK